MVRKINRIPGAPVETTNVIKLFHKILPVEKIEDFADKSQRYALQKGFFGLILLSGYHSIPNENHFWSTADDVCVSIVPRVMARNKFKNVKRYFHLFGVFQEKLSIDESMGGVDTMDMLLSSYRPKIRSRKWWWNLFNNALNIAVVAAWRLHCELHDADRSTMTHLAFRRDITAHLLRTRPLQISRPGPRIHLPHSLRSSRGHFLQYPIPNFSDFVTQLSGRTIFSEVSLIPAYQQIPVAEEIPKAAIATSFSLYEYEGVRWDGLLLATWSDNRLLCDMRWSLFASMLPTKRELGKRGGRAGSNRTDDTDAVMNLQFDTGVSSFNNDRGSNPVEARNEPARESGSEVAEKYNLTLNNNKCEFTKIQIKLLRHIIKQGTLKPDPKRFKPL
ncbi:hypothetical protein T06_8973 [Trichinella sp. T6]|nr:hypothetical protein T06_8973 [Trichinella sp. T6]